MIQAIQTTKPDEKTRSHLSTQPAAESPFSTGQEFGISTGLPLFLQPKLAISQPDDPYEQEAERVAEQVMRMSVPVVQRQCAACASGGQPCPACEQEEPVRVSRKAQGAIGGDAPASVGSVIRSPGQPLAASTRAFFEPRFGQDLSQVRVHTDRESQQSVRDVNALAYTVGSHVVFGDGRYAPGTPDGQRLLAHELTHVVQQVGGLGTTLQRMCPPPEHLGDVDPPQPCVLESPGSLARDYFSMPLRFCFDSDNLVDEDAANIRTLRERVSLLLLDGTRSVHIHGYASSPGTMEYNNALACHRAAAVRAMLDLPTTASAEARIILHSHGETTAFGEPLLENQRVVVSLDRPPPRAAEVIEGPEIPIAGSAAPLAVTSGCRSWETAMINSHLADARTWLNTAEPLVRAYVEGRGSSADRRVVEAALRANFHTVDHAHVAIIASQMRALRTALGGALDFSCHDRGICDSLRVLAGAPFQRYFPGISDTLGYYTGDVGFCAPWFDNPYYLVRVSTILHEVGHAMVGLGVVNDVYEDQDAAAYATLSPEAAMDNPDSYAAAIRQIYHRNHYGPNELVAPGEPPRTDSGATP